MGESLSLSPQKLILYLPASEGRGGKGAKASITGNTERILCVFAWVSGEQAGRRRQQTHAQTSGLLFCVGFEFDANVIRYRFYMMKDDHLLSASYDLA